MGNLLFVAIILGSLFLRFYGLTWGEGFFFHPDERNIAAAVTQLRFPQQLNPHFFAYGSFPIYLIYLTGTLWNFLSQLLAPRGFSEVGSISSVSFEQAILISRFYSALFSTMTTVLLYFVVKKIRGKREAILAVFLSTTSIGLVQFAHFSTFEMWLAFLGVILFYFCLKIAEERRVKNLLLAGLILGLLVATKISSLALLPLPAIAIFLNILAGKKRHSRYTGIFALKPLLTGFSLLILVASLIFVVTSPFALLDFSSFFSSLRYESSVALGTLPVFYTSEFWGTIPAIFQFLHIYPFLLNPLITVLFIPSLFYVMYSAFKKNTTSYYFLFSVFCFLFLSQAFFFAKWTRYMIPTLPFIYIIVSLTLSSFFSVFKKALPSWTRVLGYGTIVFVSLTFTFSYFFTVYLKPDTRILAALWAKENLPRESLIMSEVYDLGITPFNQSFPNITLFNFYELDNNSPTSSPSTLTSLLSQINYIVLPSQRILKVRLAKANAFPNGHWFYKALMREELGFEKIYETPCDVFCRITYLENPVFTLEQTTSVFDRPTIFIFQRVSREL